MIANQIDIVHTHNKKPLIYGTIAAKLANVSRIVHTRHGQAADVVPWYIWKLNSKVVTISEDAKICLMNTNRIAESHIEVIENGIPLDKFDSISTKVSDKLKNEIGLLSENQVIGIVARLAVEKDHKTSIHAFSEVLKANENAILLIVGDGPLNESLRELARDLAIESSIRFLGFRQNIAELISIFDIFVLSSTSEGMSLTLLEAMASKKPIVATNVGGNPEVVQDQLTGFIVPPQNPTLMAHAISNLLKDNELAKEFGLNGYQRIKSKYSLVSMTEKYKKLYQS
jgi:glycosyltransferase involved in cell wall biosynthesis